MERKADAWEKAKKRVQEKEKQRELNIKTTKEILEVFKKNNYHNISDVRRVLKNAYDKIESKSEFNVSDLF